MAGSSETEMERPAHVHNRTARTQNDLRTTDRRTWPVEVSALDEEKANDPCLRRPGLLWMKAVPNGIKAPVDEDIPNRAPTPQGVTDHIPDGYQESIHFDPDRALRILKKMGEKYQV